MVEGGKEEEKSSEIQKGEEIRLGFVVSEFHRDITYQMEILGREHAAFLGAKVVHTFYCLLYTSPSPRDRTRSRMPSSA